MPAGKVDRNVLSSNYQQPGDIYQDGKTEGAFEVIAQQTDDNWDYLKNLENAGKIVELGIVNVKDKAYGAKGDGVTDDSVAFQNAINSLPNGGEILCPGKFLIGNILVNTQRIRFVGRSKDDQLVMKNGTIGITVRQHNVDFENLTITSQGTRADGLGTKGILYETSSPSSIGFASFSNVDIKNFSGYGMKVINPIHFSYDLGYITFCEKGIIFDVDPGIVYFGTTVTIKRVYITACYQGIYGVYLRRSSFENLIAEYNDYGIYLNIGSVTLHRCYFEQNFVKGCYALDCEIQDLYSYNYDPVKDAVDVNYTGAFAPADRGHIRFKGGELLSKKVGLRSNFGLDPKYFTAFGDDNNIGLKYGENIVPLIRGDNLANPAAWASNTLLEFQGYSQSKQGYAVKGTTTSDPTYGLKQDIVLDSTKQYVIDLATTTIAGSGLINIKCGAVVVKNGVPFTPAANGLQTVKAYGSDTTGTAFECYVHAFSISEVKSQEKYTPIAQERLSKAQRGRGNISMSAAPTSGTWSLGEAVDNSNPTGGGYMGWVCVTPGTPGTWKGFGLIQV